VGSNLVSDAEVLRCVDENFDIKDFPSIGSNFGADAATLIEKVLREGTLENRADLSFLVEIDTINSCLSNS
jgi:hypothetical protein